MPNDKRYLAWIASQGCMICRMPATVHHVRICGSERDDTRTLPLCPIHHQLQWGPRVCIEMGKRKFEALHGVDIEAKVKEYRERYEASSRARITRRG